MEKNVFVLGLNEFNLDRLNKIEHAETYRFHQLLSLDEVMGAKKYPLAEWIRKAQLQLRSFSGTIDAIIGFWDFPVSPLVPILSAEFGTRAPSLRSVVKCEHKYWSRIEQQKVIPENIPDFTAVNPFAKNPLSALNIDFPLWLKPVKAFASQLGYYIKNEKDFDNAIDEIKRSIGRFAEPFNHVLDLVDLPSEIEEIDGHHCLAESILCGKQCTLSGYVCNGVAYAYGIIDSINYPGTTSFFRYHYPSDLDASIKKRMIRIGEDVMAHMGFDNSPFNIEFFYDEESDHLWLLEINTRISQSHSYLFEKVDGASNHQLLVELALGEPPRFPLNEGPYECAGKYHPRVFKDGVVTKYPGKEELEKVKERFPDAVVIPLVKKDHRLCELLDQDSYSYRLAVIYLGGRDQKSLLDKYKECLELLDYRVNGEAVTDVEIA